MLVPRMKRNASLLDMHISMVTLIGYVIDRDKAEGLNVSRIYMYSVLVCALTVDFPFGASPVLYNSQSR